MIRWPRLLAALVVLLMMAGARCGSPDRSSPRTSRPVPSPSKPVAASPAFTFATRTFVLPLTVTSSELRSLTMTESPHLITWRAAGTPSELALLVPVLVYSPDSSAPLAPPTDFPGYIRRLAAAGARLSGAGRATVDGRPAALFTVSTTRTLDGVLGCPSFGSDRRTRCSGLRPGFVWRIAVIDVDGITMLAWARQGQAQAQPHVAAAFELLLRHVHFR